MEGSNIVSGGEQQLITTDTLTIRAQTVLEGHIRSDETNLQLLGSYRDPVFGTAFSAIYTQVRLSEFGKIENASVDSTVLTLAYNTIYGTTEPQLFSVYRLQETISLESTAYSNSSFNYEPLPLASVSGYVPVSSSNGGNSILRFSLSQDFGEFLLQGDTSDYSSDSAFAEYFNGFYVRPENSVQAVGEGGVLYLDLRSADSKLMLYYKDVQGNSQSFEYYINTNSARLSQFEHDYSGTAIEAILDDKGAGKDKIYIQSMGGLRGKLEIPYLKNIIAQYKQIAVTKAELSFFLEDDLAGNYPPHERLYIAGINAEGKSILIADEFEGESHYGGNYDPSEGKYTFNITRHMQGIMNDFSEGKKTNFGLLLIGAGNSVNANRTILKGTDRDSARIRLTLSFTPL